ncbi:MAG TPA: hypothetical protein VFF06_19700 [Polyangia bacterium]|nr:hypothetical protein [Polyangia bacterium]
MRIAAVALALVTAVAGSAGAQHPESAAARAERLRQAEVVVVTGSADHMEQVLKRAQIKFVVVAPDELPQLPLHGQQVLMVNCTGEMSEAARERVRRFVMAGGFLYTTDHAVHYLLESAFPGFVRWNGKTSTEEIFPMQVSGERGLLKHIGGGQGHPRWQLAGGGYLFDVVDKQRVETLMSSKQVAARYAGSSDGVLGVRFRVGDGQVIHVTGHFFTQPGQRPEVAAAGQAFEQLSSNVVAEKRADQSRLDGLYNVAPRREVTMQAAPAPTAAAVSGAGGESVSTKRSTKVRVLERQGDYSRVRDAEGNEGYVPNSAL